MAPQIKQEVLAVVKMVKLEQKTGALEEVAEHKVLVVLVEMAMAAHSDREDTVKMQIPVTVVLAAAAGTVVVG